jgi:hypothetical protein
MVDTSAGVSTYFIVNDIYLRRAVIRAERRDVEPGSVDSPGERG